MKALIAKNEKVYRTSSWRDDTQDDGSVVKRPVISEIPGAYRVSQVEENEFSVHSDLFWVDCDSSVKADFYYYDSNDSTIKIITHEPKPE